MNKVLYGALLLALAFSPFEAGYPPLGRFLWATFTDLEGVLFLLAAAFMLTLATNPEARHRLLRLPLRWPVMALVGSSVISTLFAEYSSLGVQFTYRLLMGVMVYAAAWEALSTRRRFFGALMTFVGAGAVSAVLGLLEFTPVVDIQPFLRAFKPHATQVGGILRLSGSFEYANGAAMYFEMALPVLISIVMLFSARPLILALFGSQLSERKRWAIVAGLCLVMVIYVMALILTLSRAALMGLLVALAVFAVGSLVRRRPAPTGMHADPAPVVSRRVIWRSLAITMSVMALGGLLVFVTQPMFRLRLLTQNDLSWYRATITAASLPSLSASGIVTVPVTVRNDGEMVWPASGLLPVHVSYHWMSQTENVYLVFEGLRTVLPHDVDPGETVTVLAIVQAPSESGTYRLQWDLVHETVTWFERKQGLRSTVQSYTIGAAAVAANTRPPPSAMPPPVDVQSISDTSSVERSELWRVAWAMFRAHPITGVGPDGFRNLYGEYAGVTQWNRNIYTNNTYIEMFTNLGLLGGLAFLWLAALALWQAGRALLTSQRGPMWLLGLGASASLAAFFTHGVVDY
ncbi:MAG: O-antigen ligase family protein, partial [Chloroflexota bacterium]